MKNPRNDRSKNAPQPFVVENLEERQLLSIAIPTLPGTDLIASLAGELTDLAFEAIPDDVRAALPSKFERDIRALNSAFIYQAFPGEINNVRMFGELNNSLLMLTESSDVSMIRIPPAISPDVIKSIKLTFTAKGEGGGSFVGHLAGGIGLNFEGLLDATFKNLLQLPKVDLITMNGLAWTDLIPGLNDLVDSFNGFLDFDVADYFMDDLMVIPSLDVPDWVPLIGGVEIFPGWEIPIPDFVDDVFSSLPTSLRDFTEFLPGPVGDVIAGIEGVLNFIQGTFSTSGITISTLDGNDTINLSALTGIPQTVIAGTGNDTIIMGGGQNVISSWGVSFYDNVNDKTMELFGDEGNDTFIINPNFHARDVVIDGGDGSDRLVIEGSAFGDIIRLVAGPNGTLQEIRFEAENADAGTLADEVQLLALPGDTIGGSFTLTVDGVGETGAIAWNAAGTDIKAALVAAGVDAADVTVNGGAAGPWTIAFTGALGNTDLPPLTADGTNLQRRDIPIPVSEVAASDVDAGHDEVQRIILPSETTGGTFKLRLASHAWTAPIQHDAAPADVRAAILATAPGLTTSDIEVTGTAPLWYVKFTGTLGNTDQPMMETDGAGLSGGLDMAVVETIAADAGVNQTQTIPGPSGTGTFKLGFTREGVTRWTGNLPVDALALEIELALENLGTIGEDNVSVTGTSGGQWVVEFIGDMAAQTHSLILTDIGSIANDGSVVLDTDGVDPGVNEVQTVTPPSNAAGYFRLSLTPILTEPISNNATAAQVQTALNAQVASDMFSVTGPTGGPWDVEFVGALAEANWNMFSVQNVMPVVAQTTAAVAPTNQMQTITLPAEATGGTFELWFGAGYTATPSGAIAYNASAATVQAKLEAMASIGAGNVTVTKPSAGTWRVTFTGDLAGQTMQRIGANGDMLRGALGDDIRVLERQAGSAVNEVQRVQLPGIVFGGTFTLSFEGNTTGAIAFDADEAAVKAALVGTGVAADDLVVTGSDGVWDIEFAGSRQGQDQSGVTADGSLLLYTGGSLDISEQTKGSDGGDTVVMNITRFTSLVNVESIQINGGGGDDVLIIDNSAGAIEFPEGIQFTGGAGVNKVIFEGDVTEAALSSEHTSSKSTHVFSNGMQTVIRSSSRVYDFTPTATGVSMIVNGSSSADLIELTADGNMGKVNTGSLKLYFQNKESLTIDAGSGDDQIRMETDGLETMLETIVVEGGNSIGGDTLVLVGADGDDAFEYSPATPTGGMMTWTVGSTARTVAISGMEFLEAWGGDNTTHTPGDSLTFNANNAVVTPTANPGEGTATGVDLRARAILALAFSGMETNTVNTGDVLVLDGSTGNDFVTIQGGRVTITNLFGGENVFDVSNAKALILNLLSGGDEVYILGGNQFINGMLIDGGDPTYASDIVHLITDGVAATVDFVHGRIDGIAGGGVQLDRVEELNIIGRDGVADAFNVIGYGSVTELERVRFSGGDVNGDDGDTLDVTLTDGSDELTFTPTGVGSARLQHGTGGPDIIVSEFNSELGSLSLRGAGSVDSVVAKGTFGDDQFTVSQGGIGTSMALQAGMDNWMGMDFADFAVLTVLGDSGNDLLIVDNTNGLVDLPSGTRFDGGYGSDTLMFVGDRTVDAIYDVGPGVGDGKVTHMLNGDVQTVLFNGLEPVIDLVPGALIVNGTNTGNVISYDVGDNSGTGLVGGVATGEVSVDNYETIEFGNKTSLRINGLAGGDEINLNNSPNPAGLAVSVYGGTGNDTIIGTAGDDMLYGEQGDDLIKGQDGNDVLVGGDGDDTLMGDAGNDELYGNAGDDVLVGGDGDDFLNGGTGSNDLDGGTGTDTALFETTEDADEVAMNAEGLVINGVASTINDIEIANLNTLGGDDTIELDVYDGFPFSVSVDAGDDDDHVDVLLGNTAPLTWIEVDGGGQKGDTATVKGAPGNDQFDTYGMSNRFGQSSVELSGLGSENPLILEGRMVDQMAPTVEVRKFKFFDADLNTTVVSMSGPGHVNVYRDIFGGRAADIYSMELFGTTSKRSQMSVRVASKRGTDNETSIGTITGSGLRAITAMRSDLVGNGIELTGALLNLRIDDINDGADILLAGESGQRMRMRAGEVGNVNLTTNTKLDLVNTKGWAGGTIQGSVLGRLTIKGDFGADLVNKRVSRLGYGLGSLKVIGNATSNITADRIQSINVTGGDAMFNIDVITDGVTLDRKVAFGSLTVVGGNLIGANIVLEPHSLPEMNPYTLLKRLSVRASRGKGGDILGGLNIVDGSLGSVNVGGDVHGAVNIDGNLKRAVVRGDVNTTGWQIGGEIGSLTTKGTFRSSQAGVAKLRSGGSIGKLTLGAIENVDVFAGIHAAAGRFAANSGDFNTPGASIGSINIKGYRTKKGQLAPRFVVNSNFSAASMGRVKMTNIDLATSGVHVLGGGDEIKSLSHRDKVDKARSFRYPGKAGVISVDAAAFVDIV